MSQQALPCPLVPHSLNLNPAAHSCGGVSAQFGRILCTHAPRGSADVAYVQYQECRAGVALRGPSVRSRRNISPPSPM